MTTYTYNRFKDTTIYGNLSVIDGSNNSSVNFHRNLEVGGDISCNSNIFCNDISLNDLYLARGLTTSSVTESIF